MQIDISAANADAAGRMYLTWAPAEGAVRVTDPGERPHDDVVQVTLSNGGAQDGGRLEFAAAPDKGWGATLDLTVPADGRPVPFWAAGEFGRPSTSDGDAAIQVSETGSAQPAANRPVMVRVRKDANDLSAAERERFTTALAKLNDQGAGVFKDFREMHRLDVALDQAHSAPGFLSWHRAYLLDLERQLQAIDPSVTLPYWRFDRPAPNVFTDGFMGTVGAFGNVVFSATNLLRQWRTDGAPGISRQPLFDVRTTAANVRNEVNTLALGGAGNVFDGGPNAIGFDVMEGDPHGRAHTSFSLWISDAHTAPRDPLFFLLHCNVDRLWALWQWLFGRFDGEQASTYFFRGDARAPGAALIGHNLHDSLWPWDNDTGAPRPHNAPRTPFPVVATAPGPGPVPTVGDMIDYLGLLNPRSDMNFAYDVVPYGVASN